ncbi:MAG: hydantoinase B/oxoprolinase family protein, partial [SAR324 cluster bacterium]|nr:hydantoinase B/oxoprolinase family protein [SAR324 cluster bacterium]
MNIDPLTLAVVGGALEQIAEEMDLTMKRTAFSPVISEANDLANGIYHPQTGEVIVQG